MRIIKELTAEPLFSFSFFLIFLLFFLVFRFSSPSIATPLLFTFCVLSIPLPFHTIFI